MAYFTWSQKARIARSLLRRRRPVYVQYYVTARCNMACRHCNINCANADLPEIGLDQIRRMAENLRAIGTSIVLLIGGEPFMRDDLAEIVRAFTDSGIHVRLQTNGLATRHQLAACVAAGAKDISISLDTLDPQKQEAVNGGFEGSFETALRAAADVNAVFPDGATAFFGTVLMPDTYRDVPAVIRFAAAIGWGVSLVPVHVAQPRMAPGFRSPDETLRFPPSSHGAVKDLIDECRQLRDAQGGLYDSDEYLDDVVRFLCGRPVQWRRRNAGLCDSPNLYFAVGPDGSLAPCCDYRLPDPMPVYDPGFPRWFRERDVHRAVAPFTEACPGCMYGSYPEMTISARFLPAMLRRLLFFSGRRPRLRKLSVDEMLQLAAELRQGGGRCDILPPGRGVLRQ